MARLVGRRRSVAVLFASGHASQGSSGAIRTGIVGAVYTIVVAMLGSLWPAIVLHFIWDLGMGVIAHVALRQEQLPVIDVERRAEAQTAPGI